MILFTEKSMHTIHHFVSFAANANIQGKEKAPASQHTCGSRWRDREIACPRHSVISCHRPARNLWRGIVQPHETPAAPFLASMKAVVIEAALTRPLVQDPVWKHRRNRLDTTSDPDFDYEAWKRKHTAYADQVVPTWTAAVKKQFGSPKARYACVGWVACRVPMKKRTRNKKSDWTNFAAPGTASAHPTSAIR